ncbi:MAG: YkgJ family cysteine cluster protein [Candidatus Micrarchaeota archaeon]|nr:YkgJ family cysteine cluster protein [Candidatus Micrarchaeota archaeon]
MEKISQKIVNPCKNCTARCCRVLSVVLTVPEAMRLVRASGRKAEEILEFSSGVNYRHTPHYPVLAFEEGQLRDYFLVIRHSGEDCIFLGKDCACALYSERPFVCQLYPFDLDGAGMKKGALCPVKFGREKDAPKIAEALRADLLRHGEIVRKWNVTHKEKPTVENFFAFLEEEKLQPYQ